MRFQLKIIFNGGVSEQIEHKSLELGVSRSRLYTMIKGVFTLKRQGLSILPARA